MKKKIFAAILILFGTLLRLISLSNTLSELRIEEVLLNLIAIFLLIPICIFIYQISKEVSKSEEAAFFSLILGIFLPFYSWIEVTAFSNSIAMLFLLSIIYFTPKINGKYYLLVIALPIFYVLLIISGWIILPVLIFYYMLLRLEHLKNNSVENYFLIISITSLSLLLFAINYSGSFAYIFRLNLLELLRLTPLINNLKEFNLDKLFSLFGVLPVIFGLLGTYFSTKKSTRLSLFIFSVIGCSFLSGIIIGSFFSYLYVMVGMCCLSSLGYLWIKKSLNLSIFSEFSRIILLAISSIIFISGTVRLLS